MGSSLGHDTLGGELTLIEPFLPTHAGPGSTTLARASPRTASSLGCELPVRGKPIPAADRLYSEWLSPPSGEADGRCGSIHQPVHGRRSHVKNLALLMLALSLLSESTAFAKRSAPESVAPVRS